MSKRRRESALEPRKRAALLGSDSDSGAASGEEENVERSSVHRSRVRAAVRFILQRHTLGKVVRTSDIREALAKANLMEAKGNVRTEMREVLDDCRQFLRRAFGYELVQPSSEGASDTALTSTQATSTQSRSSGGYYILRNGMDHETTQRFHQGRQEGDAEVAGSTSEADARRDRQRRVDLVRRGGADGDAVALARKGLLGVILSYLAMSSGEVTEEDLASHLRELGVDMDAQQPHRQLGDVGVLVRKTFTSERFLQRRKLTRAGTSQYLYAWGDRVIAEMVGASDADYRSNILAFIEAAQGSRVSNELRSQFLMGVVETQQV